MDARATIRVGEIETQVALISKEYKSGKRGFWGQTKVQTEDGKRYQAQVMLVEIGS